MVLQSGQTIQGMLVGVRPSGISVTYSRNGKSVSANYNSGQIAVVSVGGYAYQNVDGRLFSQRARDEEERRQRIAAESKRRGAVTVRNDTDRAVTLTLRQMRDVEGNAVSYDSGRGKSNLEQIASAFSGNRSDGPPSWVLKPGSMTALSIGGERLVTSRMEFELTTSDGSAQASAEKRPDQAEFEITLKPKDLHSPVLAKFGEWRLEQDISYTTHRARSPTTIYPVKGFFSGKIDHYEVYGGEEYDYTRENRSGYATVWAEVENPTGSTLDVSVDVEFRFSHLLLSTERVRARISIAPKAKTKIYLTVNTRAILGNRKATSFRIVDITTDEVRGEDK